MSDVLVDAESAPSAVDDDEWSPEQTLATLRSLAPFDVAVVGWVAMFLVFHIPSVAFVGYTPRFALLLAALPIGAFALVRQVRGGDPAAIAASCLVVIGAVSGAIGSSPLLSLRGRYGTQTSVLYIGALFAAWAAGRLVSRRAWPAIVWALGFGLAANLFVGLLQLVIGIDSGLLGTFPGRASGLMANAVYLGAVMAGAAVVACWLWVRQPRAWMLLALALAAFGASISGSRGALGAIVIVAIASLVGSAPPFRRSATALGALFGGALVGQLVTATTSGRLVADRFAKGGDGRFEIWGFALDAFFDRPVLGWGLGSFRSAVQQRFTSSFASDPSVDARLQPWFDPHNVVVTVAVGTGVIGLVCLVAFVYSCARTARGPFALFAAVAASTWLLQPMSVNVAPLAMVLLGVAMPVGLGAPRWSRALGVVGALLFVAIISWAAVLDSGLRNADGDRAASVAGWWGPDAFPYHGVSQAYIGQAGTDPAAFGRALDWAERTTEVDPETPRWWNELASLQLVLGAPDEAGQSLATALELQPNNLRTWELVLVEATQVGDDDRIAEAAIRVCELGGECP